MWNRRRAAWPSIARESGRRARQRRVERRVGGEYNRRHNVEVRSTVKMVKAGAIGLVIQGDKEDKAKTDMLNTTHVVDVGGQKLYHERANGAAHAAMPGEIGA